MKNDFGPLIIERFIEGREFNIGLIECSNGKIDVFSVLETVYCNWPKDKPKLVTHYSNWDKSSFEFQNIKKICNPQNAPINLIKKLALKCWFAFNLKGYAKAFDYNREIKTLHIFFPSL